VPIQIAEELSLAIGWFDQFRKKGNALPTNAQRTLRAVAALKELLAAPLAGAIVADVMGEADLVVVACVLGPLVEVIAKGVSPLPTSDPEVGNELDENEDEVAFGKSEAPELVVGQPLGTVPDSVDTDPDTHGYTLGTEELDGSRCVPLKGMGALLDADIEEMTEGAATLEAGGSALEAGGSTLEAAGGSAPLLPLTLPPTA